jgi:hypothetical protein
VIGGEDLYLWSTVVLAGRAPLSSQFSEICERGSGHRPPGGCGCAVGYEDWALELPISLYRGGGGTFLWGSGYKGFVYMVGEQVTWGVPLSSGGKVAGLASRYGAVLRVAPIRLPGALCVVGRLRRGA